MSAWHDLANAIIEKAVDDYRVSLKRIRKCEEGSKRRLEAEYTKGEVEQFLLSSYFQVLTDLDGKTLLHRLQEEDRKKHGERKIK